MKTVTSISGGQSSAYIAANYPSDFLVFACVCIEDTACTPKDAKLVQMVSDRIGRDFIATAEDDTVLHTIFDLEQYLGQHIDWVAGETFDHLIKRKGNHLPNRMTRYCTTGLKLRPMFRWWKEQIGEPVEMQIGFRAGEENRAANMLAKTNEHGLLEFEDIIGQHQSGRNKWKAEYWQKPAFPMIDNGVRKDAVQRFWKDKPVRFAVRNNCIGCYWRGPMLLRKMAETHPAKFDWWIAQETKGRWREDASYSEIKRHRLQLELTWDDFTECDSGHCGL